MNTQSLKQELKNIWEDIKLGARKADIVQGRGTGPTPGTTPGASAAKAVNAGYKPGATTVGKGLGYGQSILDPRFKSGMKGQGVTLRGTPAQFLGAYASRLAVDAANDGTRTYWWRYNHPYAISQAGVSLGVNANVIESPTERALTALALTIPAAATAGTFDITNPEEQFRPKGYAQSYAQEGSQDRRKSTQPTEEMFERFFLGRTGKPLKYETAKQDIPDLTPQRYGNYMNYLYNDKGLFDLGIIKGTMENLQGTPEIRILGFPATLPFAGGITAGTLSAHHAAKALRTSTTPTKRVLGTIAAAFGGSVAGVATGNLTNSAIAAANRPQLPPVSEYS